MEGLGRIGIILIVLAVIFLVIVFSIIIFIRYLIRSFTAGAANMIGSSLWDVLFHPKTVEMLFEEKESPSWPNRKDRENMERLLQKDAFFSEQEMKEKAVIQFERIHSAMERGDWRMLGDFMDDGLFQDYYARIEQMGREGKKYVYRQQEAPVLYIESFVEAPEKEYLHLLLKANMRSYLTDAKTGKLLSGETMRAEIRWYRMVYLRPLATEKTRVSDRKHAPTNCPNCGSPHSIALRGICEYCGSVIKNANHDWILSGFQRVSDV